MPVETLSKPDTSVSIRSGISSPELSFKISIASFSQPRISLEKSVPKPFISIPRETKSIINLDRPKIGEQHRLEKPKFEFKTLDPIIGMMIFQQERLSQIAKRAKVPEINSKDLLRECMRKSFKRIDNHRLRHIIDPKEVLKKEEDLIRDGKKVTPKEQVLERLKKLSEQKGREYFFNIDTSALNKRRLESRVAVERVWQNKKDQADKSFNGGDILQNLSNISVDQSAKSDIRPDFDLSLNEFLSRIGTIGRVSSEDEANTKLDEILQSTLPVKVLEFAPNPVSKRAYHKVVGFIKRFFAFGKEMEQIGETANSIIAKPVSKSYWQTPA